MKMKLTGSVLILLLLWGWYATRSTSLVPSSIEEAGEVAPRDGGFTVENYDSNLNPHVYSYASPPKRIVAMWQNSIETLLAFGAGNRIIAASGVPSDDVLSVSCVAAYRQIPIRSPRGLDVETLLMLEPDLIVGWLFDFVGRGNGQGRSDFWEKRGTNIYMTTVNINEYKAEHTLFDEIRFIRDMAVLAGRKEAAEQIEAEIEAAFHHPERGEPPLRVVVIGGMERGIHIYTPRTLPGDLLRRLGAEVLGKEIERVGEEEAISYEELLVMDPDVIFIQNQRLGDEIPQEKLYRHPALQGLKAVRNHRIYGVPFFMIRCPGIRILDGIRLFRHGLYGV